MNGPFFVEVLARNGEVRHRHQLDILPIRIGRAYDNDFIVDDPHVAAHHALIYETAEDGLAIRDLGSRNGIVHAGRHQREMPLEGDTVVRLGQTNLRVRAVDFAVPSEVPDMTAYGWEGWPPALAGLLLILLVTIPSTWLDDFEKFKALRYLTAIAAPLCVGLLWAGMWAFASRLFGGQARFGRHLFITGCGLLVLSAWHAFSVVVAYALSLEWLVSYGNHADKAILAAMVFFHLVTINPRGVRPFLISSMLIAVVASGSTLVSNYQNNDRLTDALYMSYLLPPSMRQSPEKSVTQFLDEVADLKKKTDEARTRSVDGDEVKPEKPDN